MCIYPKKKHVQKVMDAIYEIGCYFFFYDEVSRYSQFQLIYVWCQYIL